MARPEYILIEPQTPRGKHLIAQRLIGGRYKIICECKCGHSARVVMEKLCPSKVTE